MAAYNKFNITCQDFARAIYNLSTTCVLKIKLSNTLPTATMNTSTEITEISTAGGGGYTLGGSSVAIASAIQSSGVYKLLQNAALVFTASGGTIGPFQYAVLYYSTGVTSSTINGSSAPALAWYDYGSAITLNNTETFTLTWDGSSGILQIT
jgi:hypothetical protein